MAETKIYAISTITRGMCLESRPTGLFTNRYDDSGKTREQLWTIEQGDDGKSIAFRNVADGKYLRSTGKNDGAKAETGKKTWWTMEPGDSPWSWWLKSTDFGNYLCNYYGYQTPNNKVWMWSSNLTGWNYTMMWYVSDAKAASNFQFSNGGDAAASKKQKEDLESREKALEAKEKGINEKEASAKKEVESAKAQEAAIVEREEKLKNRENEAASKEALMKKQSAEIDSRNKATDEREKAIKARETAAVGDDKLSNKDEAGQLADAQRQVKELQQQLEAARAAEQKLAEREAEVTAREKKIEQNGRSGDISGSSSTADTAQPHSHNASKETEENAQLRKRVEDLEAQLAGSQSHSTTSVSSVVSRGRKDLNPIRMQREFGFLTRLEKPNDRGRLNPLATTVN